MADPTGDALEGALVGGLRIERLIGSGSFGTVYEATQLSLGRTVALRLIERSLLGDAATADRFAAQQRIAASIHHPAIIPTYEAGPWDGGKFVATRFIRGRALSELLEDESLRPRPTGEMMEALAGALAVAAEAGLVHGRIGSQNVLVDAAGGAHLADLGLGRPGSAEEDAAALAVLASRVERAAGRLRRRRIAATMAVTAIVGVAATIAAASGAESDDRGAAPPPPVGVETEPVGSELAAGPSLTLGCTGEPGPNTQACTLSQSSIAGRSVTVREPGVIRGWAVRGASGDLVLQVIGQRRGDAYVRGFSQVESVSDPGPHAFSADVAVHRGDRIGVVLTAGAEIGMRASTSDSAALRWEGTLPYAPVPQSSTRLHGELLLRADIEAGAKPDLEQESGRRAERAPGGESFNSELVDLPRGEVAQVDVVRVEDRIAIDVYRGGRRLARATVAGAFPTGELLAFEDDCGFRSGFCLRWLNDGDTAPIIHAYRLAAGGSALRLIG